VTPPGLHPEAVAWAWRCLPFTQAICRLIARKMHGDVLYNCNKQQDTVLTGQQGSPDVPRPPPRLMVVKAAVLCCAHGHRGGRARCRAVNISSSCAWAPVPQAAAYTASKFAVRGYSDAVRVELAPFGVHVMHVTPGAHRSCIAAVTAANSLCSDRREAEARVRANSINECSSIQHQAQRL
jgi:NAD(P)-dependent dehydrogenase (short-subunit alcohol dehydrogenase family)